MDVVFVIGENGALSLVNAYMFHSDADLFLVTVCSAEHDN